ncbi:hypothetical protein G9A89_008136 [Geosiphon pyriformis]|nr:hypothetical protein G9A89_008136 [Geosiphon pyriformis]
MRFTYFLHVASHLGQTRQHYTLKLTHRLPSKLEKKEQGLRWPKLTTKDSTMPSNLITPSESIEVMQYNSPNTKPSSLTKPAFFMSTLNLDLANHTLDQCNLTKYLTKSTITPEAHLTSSKMPTASAHQSLSTNSLHMTEYKPTSDRQRSRILKTEEEDKLHAPAMEIQ